MNRLNIKTRGDLEFISEADLSEQQMDTLVAVATALNGVRQDMRLQAILDAVVELFNAGHPYDEIGFYVLTATDTGEDIH